MDIQIVQNFNYARMKSKYLMDSLVTIVDTVLCLIFTERVDVSSGSNYQKRPLHEVIPIIISSMVVIASRCM